MRHRGCESHAPRVHARFTIAELARLLGVSAGRLRYWTRLGLIVPTETRYRTACFDFAQASLARRLWGQITRGTSLRSIRRGLNRLRHWMPDVRAPLSQVAEFEPRGRFLFRRGERLVDVLGQLRFDFAADEEAIVAIADRVARRDGDELFERALAFEDAGQFAAAADVYRHAIVLTPNDPVLHFNLGNVEWQRGQCAEAIARYRSALRLDPCYAEAWNNLGVAMLQAGDLRAAANAFRRATKIAPDYLPARRNLGLCADDGPA